MFKKGYVFILIFATIIFATGFLLGCLLTKHNNTFLLAIENRRVDIFLNIIIGILGSFFVTAIIYFNDMLLECDKFCRSLPGRLHEASELLEQYSVGLCKDRDIINLCECFFQDYLKFKKFIINKKLKALVDRAYVLFMNSIRPEFSALNYSKVSIKKAELDYENALKNNNTDVVQKIAIDGKKKLIQLLKEHPQKYFDKLSTYHDSIDELYQELSNYYSAKAKINIHAKS